MEEVVLKHILAALDLNTQTDGVFSRAVQLAVQHGSKLTLAHIAAHGDGDERSNAQTALARADKRLRELSKPSGLDVDFRGAVGNPAHEIAALARETGAELVVLGAHRENPVTDLFFETTAYYTIEGCDAPLLIVKNPTHGPYRRVLAPTDFSSCAKHALRAAMTIAPQADFHVLHVYEAPFSVFVRFNEQQIEELRRRHSKRIERNIQEEMRDFLARHAGCAFPEVKISIERDDIDAGIAKAAKRLEPDLMAMGMSGRGLAALVGSRTDEYLNAPICDLLVTP